MQQHIIHQPLPLIVDGVGGSGKTYIGLTVLKQFIHNASHHEPARILYITKEASLVGTIKNLWAELNVATPSNIQVEMLTYNELLPFDHPNDDIPHYQAWLNMQKKSSLDDITQLNEFRICSALSKEQYQKLGAKQSKLTQGEPREYLYQRHLAYQQYLTDHKLIDPVFYPLPAQPIYALIVVDEAQNLSLRQLQNIHQLAFNQAVLYCMDPQQNIVDQAPIKTLWQQWDWPKPLESVSLNQTYRCKEHITRTVNALLGVKHDILGTRVSHLAHAA